MEDRQRQPDQQLSIQTDTETQRQPHRHIDMQTQTEAERRTHTEVQSERVTVRHTVRQTDGQTDRQRQRGKACTCKYVDQATPTERLYLSVELNCRVARLSSVSRVLDLFCWST